MTTIKKPVLKLTRIERKTNTPGITTVNLGKTRLDSLKKLRAETGYTLAQIMRNAVDFYLQNVEIKE